MILSTQIERGQIELLMAFIEVIIENKNPCNKPFINKIRLFLNNKFGYIVVHLSLKQDVKDDI